MRFPSPRSRSIRFRLTAWYASLFLALGVTLIAVNYTVVDNAFPGDENELRRSVARRLGVDPDEFQSGRPLFAEGEEPRGGGRPRGPLGLGELIDETRAEVKDDTLNDVLVFSGLAFIGVGVASIAVGWFLTDRMLRPLSAVTRAARRISNENLSERVGLQGPRDELHELGDQFDTMLERLERSFAAQRDFIADASHELRTPLTIIRTELDVTLGRGDQPTQRELAEMRRVIGDAAQRAEELIERLLALARAEAGLGRTEVVDLAVLARETLTQHTPAAEAKALQVSTELDDAPVIGDRILLERLLGNLVGNAIRHNIEGGSLSLRVRPRDAGGAELSIANSGAPVPPESVDALFERFARLDDSRSRATGGFGVGLAIVRSVVDAHGGSVEAAAEPDGGLRVQVLLPARPSTSGGAPVEGTKPAAQPGWLRRLLRA